METACRNSAMNVITSCAWHRILMEELRIKLVTMLVDNDIGIATKILRRTADAAGIFKRW